MKDSLIWNRRVLVPTVLALLLFLLPGASAQQPPPSPPDYDPNSPSTGPAPSHPQDMEDERSNPPASATDNFNPDPPHPPMALSSPLFRLGGGGFLQANQSPLRLGPIYLSSAEVLGAYNAFSSSDNTKNTTQTGILMRSDIVLDKLYKNVRFTTQWEPRLSILDGISRGDIDNVFSSLDTKFDLTNRLSLRLLDHFSYFASRLLYGDYFFSAGIVEVPVNQQNSFLDTPGHALSNTAMAALDYQVSPLTRVYFSPSFNYFHTTTSSSLLNSSSEYDGAFGLEHTLSDNTRIGLQYVLTSVEFKQVGRAVYNTLSGTYAHLFSPTFSFTGSAGVSTYAVSNDPRSWTFAGSATLTKAFRASSVSIAYVRGLYLADYTTTDFTDRVDGQYNQSLGRRLTVGLGAGLQKEWRADGFRGRYAQASLSFRLSPLLSAYTRYTYAYQTGDQTFLSTGTRNLVVFGLRFQAPTPTRR
jgi:hypothetical protein